jgi:membrane protease YdiL (CAAX protease family)
MSSFIDPQDYIQNNSIAQDYQEMVEVVYTALIFLSLISASSTLIYLEVIHFSIDSKEFFPLLLGIPHAIPRTVLSKWIEINLIGIPLTITSAIITDFFKILPYTFIETAVIIYITLFGFSGILLGIFILNPAQEEQDIAILINGLVFFVFVFIFDLLFMTVVLFTKRFDVSPQIYMISIGIFINSVGLIFLALGIYNLEEYDLGASRGPLTQPIQTLGRIIGSIIIIWGLPLILFALIFLITFNLFLAIIGYYGFILLVIYLPNRLKWNQRLKGMLDKQYWVNSLAISPLIVILLLCSFIFNLILLNLNNDRQVNSQLQSILVQILQNDYIVIFIIISLIFGSFIEELFFRGWLFQQFEKGGYSSRSSIILTALFFGFMHAPLSIISFINAFILGLIFTSAYAKYRSLIMVASSHALYNIILLILIVNIL